MLKSDLLKKLRYAHQVSCTKTQNLVSKGIMSTTKAVYLYSYKISNLFVLFQILASDASIIR